MEANKAARIYFPGLDGLRFIAAFSVVVQHTGQLQRMCGNTDIGPFHHFFLSGHQGVLLFFVLSGFLITYLLLAEHHRIGSIDVGKFYMRRMLRIWPLYYLIIGLSLLLLLVTTRLGISLTAPLHHPYSTIALFLLFLPNIGVFADQPILGLSHTWTLGVEEQFYLTWPLLMKRLMKNLVWLMLGIIVIKLLLVAGVDLIEPHIAPSSRHRFNVIKMFVHTFTLESMAIGGIGAYAVFFRKQRLLDIVFHPLVQALMFLSIIGLLWLKDSVFTLVQPFSPAVVSIVFIILILNVSCNTKFRIKLDYPILNSLGRISYGIYMFHPMVIFPCILLLNKTGWNHTLPLAYNIALHLLVSTLTLAIAYFSYHYFEAPWLNLKQRFARVPSGGGADGITPVQTT